MGTNNWGEREVARKNPEKMSQQMTKGNTEKVALGNLSLAGER